jgi:hypothetical protein
MTIDTWKHRILQPSDLPKKAQQFIEMMDIDTSELRLMLLTPCPDGKFHKSFDNGELGKTIHSWAAIAEFNAIYFFSDSVKVGTAIHELTHIYLSRSKFDYGIEYDLRGMGEKFIQQHGIYALTDYAQVSILESKWEEVVCEIVATYGRRGQFDKIKELFNQQPHQSNEEGI